MRVLIAPGAFAPWLSAGSAATLMADTWTSVAGWDEITCCPLSDGGAGFLDVVEQALLADGLDPQVLPVQTVGPDGAPLLAHALLARPDGVPTVWLEAAQVVGLHLVTEAERDPAGTSSAPVADLLQAAVDAGARRVVLAVGGVLAHDAGRGMLERLLSDGDDSRDHLADDSTHASADDSGDRATGFLRPHPSHPLADVDLLVAWDWDVTLLGLSGASAQFATDKGATPEQAQQLEADIGVFVDAVRQALPEPTDLLSGRPVRRDKVPAAGAGGGLVYGMEVLGAATGARVRSVSAAVHVAELWHLAQRARGAGVLVTGEAVLDWQSVAHTEVATAAAIGLAAGVPTVAVCARSELGRRETMALGLSGVHPLAPDRRRLGEIAPSTPAGTDAFRAALEHRVTRVARTWSPRA